MNVLTGTCIIGQSENLKKRFSAYSTRAQKDLSTEDRINKNFHAAAEEEQLKGFSFNTVFQKFIVYTWVDDQKNVISVKDSLNCQNQMNYLEQRLILAFYACNLCYNLKDVPACFLE